MPPMTGMLKIGPGWNSLTMLPFHLIHKDLFIYRYHHLVKTTYKISEDTQRGGDRRLSRIGLAKATWAGDYITQAALAAFLSHVSFTDLDCLVTIRTWNGFSFVDGNAVMEYEPPEDLSSDYCNLDDGFLFTFTDVGAT